MTYNDRLTARIYQPAKHVMQSGKGSDAWVLEFEPCDSQRPERLMGWIGSRDTNRQIRLKFPSKGDAIRYATGRGIAYTVQQPLERSFKIRSYAENFR